MESNKSIAPAGYLIGVLFVFLPLLDAIMSFWPPHFGDERWRFGAAGTLSNVTLVPILGLFIMIVVATVWDHRVVRRILGALCGVLAVVVAATVVLFVLDFFQTKTIVTPRFQYAMSVASYTAMMKYVLSIIALALLSRAGFGGPRPVVHKRAAAPAAAPTPTPLIPLGGPARAE